MKIDKKHFFKLKRIIKNRFKEIPVTTQARRIAYRRRLNRKIKGNSSFSIIANDCCGGLFYHDCMLRFTSPTINLFINSEDFILFCNHLKNFVNGDIQPSKDANYNYPCGTITNEYGQIFI